MKSESSLKAFEPDQFTKREVFMREIEQQDLKFLWLDYNQGTELPFADFMDKDKFRQAAGMFLSIAGTAQLIYAPTVREDFPVGLIVGNLEGHLLFPRAYWFNWATPRNKVEGIYHYLSEARKSYTTVITSTRENRPLFNRFIRYGLLRYIGAAHEYYKEDSAFLYQTVK